MSTQPMAASRRPFRAAALAAAVLLAGMLAAPAHAAAPPADPHWLPWLGCWSVVPQPGPQGAGAPDPHQVVCIDAAAEGVALRTVGDGKTISEERIVADGQRRRVSRSGCSGWEAANWSRDGRRLFLHSELTCEGGQRRTTSGVMAMLPGGGWMDAQAVDVGARTDRAVRVRHYRVADSAALEAAGLRAAESPTPSLAVETARRAAAARLLPDDVAEATRQVAPEVVQALLVERGEGFDDLDGQTLVRLADAGVPGSITDLMIALSNPDRFQVDRATGGIGMREDERTGDNAAADSERGARGGYGPYAGYGGCGRFGYYDPFAYYDCGYAYYSPFGFGSPYGWWYGGSPVIVVERGKQQRSEAKAVKGRGYTRGGDGSEDPARRAAPRSSQPSGDHGASSIPRSGVSSGGSGSSGSSSSGSASSGAASSGGAVRHAAPKSSSGSSGH